MNKIKEVVLDHLERGYVAIPIVFRSDCSLHVSDTISNLNDAEASISFSDFIYFENEKIGVGKLMAVNNHNELVECTLQKVFTVYLKRLREYEAWEDSGFE